MVSEKTLQDSEGKSVGYELEGKIIYTDDYGAKVEIRPNRNQSAIVNIQDFDGDFSQRPHSKWSPGDTVRVLIINKSDHVLVPQSKNPSK